MYITIKKANLNSIFLSYSYIRTANNIKNKITENPDGVVHDDLKKAFRNCIPLFAHICDEVTDETLIEAALNDPEAYLEKSEDEAANEENPFLKFRVNGFEIGGKDDAEAVKLFGNKWITIGDVVGLITPFVKYDSTYRFVSELQTAVALLKKEVLAYMEGKYAPSENQLGLFGGEDDENFED